MKVVELALLMIDISKNFNNTELWKFDCQGSPAITWRLKNTGENIILKFDNWGCYRYRIAGTGELA
jgi:hypothetical protein